MDNIQILVEGLRSKDDKYAYQCLKHLEEESNRGNDVYRFFDDFAELLDNGNSYLRTRGILLIAANAKWDKDNKIDEMIDKYLEHIMDEKPITARKCIQALPLVVKAKPDLKDCVMNALFHGNSQSYQESMQPLVAKDIQKSLKEISKIS